MMRLMVIMVFLIPSIALASVQTVCINKTDKRGQVVMKNGKPQQTCKLMKKHSKMQGTKVPKKK